MGKLTDKKTCAQRREAYRNQFRPDVTIGKRSCASLQGSGGTHRNGNGQAGIFHRQTESSHDASCNKENRMQIGRYAHRRRQNGYGHYRRHRIRIETALVLSGITR